MDLALADPRGDLAPDDGEILAALDPNSDGVADGVAAQEAELGLGVDAQGIGGGQAAQERPRLGAYVRVVADSSRRILAYVRESPALLLPGTTGLVDTLGAAACVATVAAWAGLRAAPAQPRRWDRGARLVLCNVGDASRRLVASALGNTAFLGAAAFLAPWTPALLVETLAAAAYLSTAAAMAGLLAVLAQPRRGARGALLVLFIAATAYAIVAAFTDRSVFVIVSAFVPGVVELGCVIAAAQQRP